MIGIASDHHGVNDKKKIIKYFEENNKKYKDFGPFNEENVDYVDYALDLCNSLKRGEIEKGILICKTGIGMSITANKIKGIRCARVLSTEDVILTREHNDANVIAIPSSIEEEKLLKMIDLFLTTNFIEEERYIRRRTKLNNL